MFNLLLQQDKQAIKKEFRFRSAAVALLLVSAVAAAGAISIVPSFFLLIKKEEIAQRQVEILSRNASDNELSVAEESISAVVARMELFNLNKKPGESLDAIGKTVSILPKGVELDRISVVRKDDNSYTLSLGGKAESRSALVSFAESLEKLSVFDSVPLPVSYLAKDSDISFYLSMNKKSN